MIVDSSSVDRLNNSVVTKAPSESEVVLPLIFKDIKLLLRNRLWVINDNPLHNLGAGRSSQRSVIVIDLAVVQAVH